MYIFICLKLPLCTLCRSLERKGSLNLNKTSIFLRFEFVQLKIYYIVSVSLCQVFNQVWPFPDILSTLSLGLVKSLFTTSFEELLNNKVNSKTCLDCSPRILDTNTDLSCPVLSFTWLAIVFLLKLKMHWNFTSRNIAFSLFSQMLPHSHFSLFPISYIHCCGC